MSVYGLELIYGAHLEKDEIKTLTKTISAFCKKQKLAGSQTTKILDQEYKKRNEKYCGEDDIKGVDGRLNRGIYHCIVVSVDQSLHELLSAPLIQLIMAYFGDPRKILLKYWPCCQNKGDALFGYYITCSLIEASEERDIMEYKELDDFKHRVETMHELDPILEMLNIEYEPTIYTRALDCGNCS